MTAEGFNPAMRDEIDARFGLSGAHKHASVTRAQRKNVAGPRQILRARLRIDRGKDGDGAVGGADACGDTQSPINRFGERGAVHRGVDRRHQRQMQLVAAILRKRQADQPARVLRHEIDGFRRDLFGGHREVAFVFAVLVIDEHNHPPLADVFDSLFHGGKFRLIGHSLIRIPSTLPARRPVAADVTTADR